MNEKLAFLSNSQFRAFVRKLLSFHYLRYRSGKVLDIGTAIGYSAIWLARVIGKDGHITSIELDPARAERAREFVRRAGMQAQVEIITGDVFDILSGSSGSRTGPGQNKQYDVIFQDVANVMKSDDMKEGLQSFIERRTAVYKGK